MTGRRTTVFGLLRIVSLILAASVAPRAVLADPACPASEYPQHYPDAAPFEAALARTSEIRPADPAPSALVVPHHLLVPDLIAGGLRLGAGSRPERILLIHPDHFNKSPRPFATTARPFRTVLGPVPSDPGLAAALLAHPDLVADSCLFQDEHGVRALLPFIARLYPGVPVVPLAVTNGSSRSDWERMAEVLAPLVGPGTLTIQSTDFSHYLLQFQARQHDQQVLNLLAARDGDGIARLLQPAHVDSVGALWLTTVLQESVWGAAPIVVANRNQQELTGSFLSETTSYMVILYQPPGTDPPDFPDASRFMIAGDLFLGRSWPGLLFDELIAARVEQAARASTRDLPLVANLEGVLLPQMPGTLAHMTLAMPSELFLDWARRLKVEAVGLANNHAMDIGRSGLAETVATLDAAGLAHAGQGERLDLHGVALVFLTDIDPFASPSAPALDDALLDGLVQRDATVPVIAVMHWGQEWVTTPGPREEALIAALHARGVAAIVGAHPHAVSSAPFATAGGDMLVIQSLGNFLFDQTAPPVSGALAEVTVFGQGTVFLRQLPIPNLYDIARGRDRPRR